MRTVFSVLLVCGSLLACNESPPARLAPTATAPTVAAATANAGSQDQLADELDAVARELEPSATAALRKRWQGKVVRWTVTRVPALCGDEERCYVAPFASARRNDTSAHGWLPMVAFAAGEYAKLVTHCGAEPVCSVTLEGTLDRLLVSDDLPTSVHLTAVHVVEAG